MDLSADERFNTLPFVTGPPNFRFYAGTCLTTRRGINIGSLFIVDDRVRPELTASQVDFLGTVAAIVMRNLELNQEAEERNRFLKMSGVSKNAGFTLLPYLVPNCTIFFSNSDVLKHILETIQIPWILNR